MKKALFIDRDGTIIWEPPMTEQVDSLEQLQFMPGAIGALAHLANSDFELVIASNQDGLGTPANPLERFNIIHNKMLTTLEGEGVTKKSPSQVTFHSGAGRSEGSSTIS